MQSDQGVPVATIIVASFNTMMYMTLAVVIFLKFVRVELWKKIVTAGLTLPEYVGFALWLSSDTDTNRHIYIWCQYFSYFSLLATAVYHLISTISDYITKHDGGATEVELSVTGASLVLYGVLGTFFLMSF